MSDRVPKLLKDLGQHRWRAGKAPEWAPSASGVEGQREEESMKPRLSGQVEDLGCLDYLYFFGFDAGPYVITIQIKQTQVQVQHDASDRRLRRLAETRRDPQTTERHREEAEVVIGDEEGEVADVEEREYAVEREEPGARRVESEDEDDEDAMDARRERLRMLARQRRAQEEVEQV
jgi:hypothetical protein